MPKEMPIFTIYGKSFCDRITWDDSLVWRPEKNSRLMEGSHKYKFKEDRV
jgi:hypothetical protein